MDRRRWIGMVAGAVLGAGAAVGVTACGDDERDGGVEVEGAGTATSGTAPATTPTEPETSTAP